MDRRRTAIKMRQLEYFLAAAKTLNFSRAAVSLAISQPALSQQIAELETELGFPLFHRKGRTMTLTQAGVLFQAYAARSIAEVDAGCLALRELAGLQSGHLRIGVSQSFVHKMLPPIIGEFHAAYGRIRLDVTELTAIEIEKGLADGRLDIGIAFAPAILDDTELEPILEERLLLVMGANHPLAKRKKLPLAELDGREIVLFSSNYSTRGLVDRFLAMAQAIPVIAAETNSIGVMRAFVAATDIMAIIPECAVSASQELAVVQLVEPTPVRVSALLWSRSSFKTHAAQAFAALVRAQFSVQLQHQRDRMRVLAGREF